MERFKEVNGVMLMKLDVNIVEEHGVYYQITRRKSLNLQHFIVTGTDVMEKYKEEIGVIH